MAESIIKADKMVHTQTIYAGSFDSGWTAPETGTANLYCTWSSAPGNAGYCYITDQGAGFPQERWGYFLTLSATGYSETKAFPVIKGHTYKIAASANVSELYGTLYY